MVKASRLSRLIVSLGLVVLLVALVAGCGDSGDDSTTGATSGAETTGTETGETGSAQDGVAHAEEQLAKYSAPMTEYTAPGPAIDISSFKGKTIWYIPITTVVPQFGIYQHTVEDVAKRAGLKFRLCDANASAAQTASCLEQAMADPNALGIIDAGAGYALASNAFQKVWKSGLPLVMTDANPGQDQSLGPNPPASVGYISYPSVPVDVPARLASDAIIAKSDGSAHVLTIDQTDGESQEHKSEEGNREFEEYCPDCVISEVKSSIATIQTLPSAVSSAVVKDPEIEYAHAWADIFVPPISEGARQAGKSLTAASTGGSLAGLQELKAGQNGLFFNAGWNTVQQYWQAADILFRLALKEEVDYDKYEVWVRAFDEENIGELDLTEQASLTGEWYGDPAVFQDVLLETWGLK